MEDITDKYRTRKPPKEHEEAVRMLLEGISRQHLNNNQQSQQNGSSQRIYTKPSNINNNNNNKINYDRQEEEEDTQSDLTSNQESNSSEVFVYSSGNSSANAPASMRSHKATSTTGGDSTSSSSGIDHGDAYKEPIPSRTIAVQCDLKSSTAKREQFDGSMQASSISSTRYGFYNFSPETLEIKRKLEAQNSVRPLSGRGEYDSRSQAANVGVIRSQVEAPTSMSELSVSDDEVRNVQKPPVPASSASSSSRVDPEQQRAISREQDQIFRNSATLGSTRAIDSERFRTARARINSLPRRPVTAMSYVSSSRLRGQESPDRKELHTENTLQRMKSRAVSHQALNRPRTPAPQLDQSDDFSSNSDSELDMALRRSSKQILTDRGQGNANFRSNMSNNQIPSKPSRPTLADSYGGDEDTEEDYKRRTLTASQQHLPKQRFTRIYSRSHSRGIDDTTDDAIQTRIGRTALSPNRASTYLPRQTRDADHGDVRYSMQGMNRSMNEALDCPDCQDIKPVSQRDYRTLHSMSLSRKPLSRVDNFHKSNQANESNEDSFVSDSNRYLPSTTRRPQRLSRNDRAYSQTLLSKPQVQAPVCAPKIVSTRRRHPSPGLDQPKRSDVSRSISMRQISRPSYDKPHNDYDTTRVFEESGNLRKSVTRSNTRELLANNEYGRESYKRDDNENDSESPLTKTWLNPGFATLSTNSKVDRPQMSTKSMSTRNINKCCDRDERSYNAIPSHSYRDEITTTNEPKRINHQHQQQSQQQCYHSSSETSSLENREPQDYLGSQQLDYESQQRLNEIGLPQVSSRETPTSIRRTPQAASSYLGVPPRSGADHRASHRAPLQTTQITGRAMSQQSLSRPTMPQTSSRRRVSGSNSGSDVGGSSMSLMSRLHGRYENAHTRTPVVMYIPQAIPKAGSLDAGPTALGSGKSSTLRKSARPRQKSISQDRSGRRSLSRNGSDSESSSMLRTLVKPRSRVQQAAGNYSSRRGRGATAMTVHDVDNEDEFADGIGHLATDLDTYKFRRRYSVPKDAKINWFAKLKQRVSSSGAK